MKERVNNKKEQQIDNMSNEEVVVELKGKKLPTFGTGAERKDRLKKHYGNDLNFKRTIYRFMCHSSFTWK